MGTVPPEKALINWLAARFADARVVTVTPDKLADALPCIRVTRFGGGRESFPAFDRPNLDVDTFHSTRDLARSFAQEVGDAILFELPGQMIDGATFLRTREFSGPSIAPWENTNLRRFVASYSIRIHSRS